MSARLYSESQVLSADLRNQENRVRPPLWSSVQSSWLQIQRSGFCSRRYQIFWKVVGLERGPPSLMSTIEELFERKSSCSGLESQEYGCRDPSRWPHGILYPRKLAVTLPTRGGRSVDIIRPRTQATELFLPTHWPWNPGEFSSQWNSTGWVKFYQLIYLK
jgi:hypothetical protein